MANIGKIIIDMTLKNATFIGNMNKSADAVSSARAKMNTSLAGISNAFRSSKSAVADYASQIFNLHNVLFALGAQGGFIAIAKSSVEFADQIGKTADRVGLATKEYQQYKYAAKLAGMETESFDGAISTFNKNLGLAIQGQGKAGKSLKELGIDISKVASGQMTTGDVFRQVAEKIGNIGTVSQRTAILTRLFGDQGSYIGQMFAEGGDGLAAMAKQAEDLGLVLDEKVIRLSAEAMDKAEDLGMALKANFRSGVLTGFIQDFDTASSLMTNPALLTGINNIGLGIGTAAGTMLNFVTVTALAAQGLIGLNEASDSSSKLAVIAGKAMAGAWHALEISVDVVGGALALFAEKTLSTIRTIIQYLNKLPRIEIDVTGLDDAIEATRKIQEAYGAAAKDSADKLFENLDMNSTGASNKGQKDAIRELLANAGKAKAELASLNKEHQSTVATAGKADQSVKEFCTTLEKLGTQTVKVGNVTGDFFDKLISDLATSDGSIKSFRNIFISALQDISKSLLGLGNGGGAGSLGGLIATGLGSLFSGGLSTAATDLASQGGMLNIPKFAKGGIATSPSLFGDAGPEAAVPLPDGRSIPVNFKGGAGGGDVYHIDARGADQAGLARLERMIQQVHGQIAPTAIAAVDDKYKRSSSFLRTA